MLAKFRDLLSVTGYDNFRDLLADSILVADNGDYPGQTEYRWEGCDDLGDDLIIRFWDDGTYEEL